MNARTDVAALTAAVIAVPMVMFVTPGTYNFLDLVVGITLLALIFGYAYGSDERNNRQRAAIACVVGLAALPVAGAIFDFFASCEREFDSCMDETWHVGI